MVYSTLEFSAIFTIEWTFPHISLSVVRHRVLREAEKQPEGLDDTGQLIMGTYHLHIILAIIWNHQTVTHTNCLVSPKLDIKALLQ